MYLFTLFYLLPHLLCVIIKIINYYSYDFLDQLSCCFSDKKYSIIFKLSIFCKFTGSSFLRGFFHTKSISNLIVYYIYLGSLGIESSANQNSKRAILTYVSYQACCDWNDCPQGFINFTLSKWRAHWPLRWGRLTDSLLCHLVYYIQVFEYICF